jgi:tetratricopeptide (TPR) repeat protein
MEIERNLTQRSRALKFVRGLALAYRDLSAVYETLGDMPRSMEAETKSLEILQGINRTDPQNASIRRSLAIEYGNFALGVAQKENMRLALENWQKAAGIIRALVAEDPENKLDRHYLGTIEAAGGTLLMREHNPQAALKQFDKARSVYQSLRDAGWASSFEIASAGQCSEKMGEAEALIGNYRTAANDFHRALAIAEPLVARKPPNLNALYAAADAYSQLGDLSLKQAPDTTVAAGSRRASFEEARSWYSKSLETWRQIEHPNRTTPFNSLEAGDPALLAKKLRRCETALAQIPVRSK